MKIKGAFTVRWAAQNGNDGKGVTILSTTIKYAVTTNNVRPSSGWNTTFPTNIADGNYLWTWTQVKYSDGNETNAYSVARQGIDGKGIQSSVITYSLQPTNVNPDTITNWGSFPSTLTDGYWLYTRTVITYSDGNPTTSYSVSQVGVGSYYAGCEERYAAGDSATTPPQGAIAAGTYAAGALPSTTWTQERPTLNTSTPYLWNFEISHDSRGNSYVTDARCIGNFAKGIVSIVEAYAISSEGTVPSERDYPSDIANNDWQDEAHAVAPTDTKRYQWNRTTVTYNQGDPDVFYHVSAVKGLDGKGTVYIDLDNENDTILYDGSGNRISGNSVSNIKLYENGQDITSGKTFSIYSKSSTVSASISGAVLTVTGITSTDGYVIVRCIYKSVSYYARYTVKRLVGTDKYELECTPSAIVFNTDTQTGNATVTIKVYKTAQNGERTLLQSLPSNYTLKRFWDNVDTSVDMTSDYNNKGGYTTFTPVTSWSRYRVELRNNNGNLLDYETIPIGKTKDGAQGSSAFVLDADNENVGFIVEENGVVSTAQSREIGIAAYYGASPVTTGVTYTVTVDDTNFITAGAVTNGKLTISTKTATWTKNKVVKVTVTATHAIYGTRSIVIAIVPVFGGAKADYYELMPSLSAITFTKTADGKSLTPTSRTLTVQLMHITANSQSPVAIPTGYTVMWSDTDYPINTQLINHHRQYASGGISISSSTEATMIYLSLFKGTTLIDKESVPIVKGGVDGADNIGVSINLDNDMSSFPMTYAGRTTGQTTHTNKVSLYVGSALQTLTDLQITLSDTNTSNVSVSRTISNGKYTGDFTVTVKSAKSFTADKIRATIVAKSADVPDGKTIVFTLQGVRAGKEGTNAKLYELVPSQDTISFGRDSSDNLIPSSLTINCGYQENDGGTITNYAGTLTANLWKNGGAPYNMMYRFQESDGSWSTWAWAKDLTNGALVIRNTTTRLALEYILTSADGISSVKDTNQEDCNIIDRETIPIVREGQKGGTGDDGDDATTYWLVPSAEEVTRKQNGQLSVSKLTCAKMKKTGEDDATTATDATITYNYTELGEEHNGNSYPTAGVTVGLWWNDITFIAKVGGVEVARKTVYFKDETTAAGANLINGTNFEDAKDSGTTYNADNVLAGGVDGVNYITDDAFVVSTATYRDFFKSIIHKSDDLRLMPSTWYTLSFWAKAEAYYRIDENITLAQYGFAREKTFFTKGAHFIFFNGLISAAAKAAGKELRVFVYKEDWSWSASAATSNTTATTVALNFTAPETGEYMIAAYVYKTGETTISNTSWTATLNYYQIYSDAIRTHVYPSVIDTSYVQVADGVSNEKGRPSDGNCDFKLSTAWTHHTYTFRTKSTIPAGDIQTMLFRHKAGTSKVYICKPKLERGIFATEWGRSEHDKTGGQGVDGLIMRTTEWAAGQEYHNDSDLTTSPRFLDIVVTGAGTGSPRRFMCKKTHPSTASGNTGNPASLITGTSTSNTYWQELSNNFPIYTPLLLADNALIRFAQTTQLLIADTNGNVIAGLGKGNFPLFIGATQNNPTAAPFRVTKQGKLIAYGAEITGGFSGFLRREPLTITNANYRNYCYADADRPYIPWDNAPLINLMLTGRYIVFSGNTTTISVFLPSASAQYTTWHEHAAEARKYVGQTVLIENRNSGLVRIEGIIGTSLELSGIRALNLSNNEFMELECVHDIVNTDKEIIYWKYKTGKLLV